MLTGCHLGQGPARSLSPWSRPDHRLPLLVRQHLRSLAYGADERQPARGTQRLDPPDLRLDAIGVRLFGGSQDEQSLIRLLDLPTGARAWTAH